MTEEETTRHRGPVQAVCGAFAAPTQAVRDAYAIYHPATARDGRSPADKGLPVRTVRITTSRDRVPLDTWVVPGAGPHTVVICHGMSRSKSQPLDHVKLLHEAGHHVVAYDMRNHGASGRDGRYGRMADRFTGDLRDMLGYVRQSAELGSGRIAVLAFSFSTWPALYVLRNPGVAVAAVICDSGPFHDIDACFRHFADLRRASLPRHLQGGAAFRLYRKAFRLAGQRMLAVDRAHWPPALAGSPTRLMFVAGGMDPVVPADQVMAVAARYPDATVWVAPKALHMNAVRFERAGYRDRVLGFLAAAFADAAQPVVVPRG